MAVNWQDYWHGKSMSRLAVLESGKVLVEYIHTRRAGRVHVTSLPHYKFIRGARELSGTWRHRSKVWTFRPACSHLVIALCKEVYGAANVVLKGFDER